MSYERKALIDSCGKCFEGVVFALLKENTKASHFVFRCSCGLGRRSYIGDWPVWSDYTSIFKREIPNWVANTPEYS